MANSRWRRLAPPAVAITAALTLSGCLQNPDAGSGQGGFGADAQPEEGDGVVTILGAFGGGEETLFLESLADFEAESGIDIQYVSDQDFTTTVLLRVNSGDAPDIGLFPQPGGVMQLAAEGDVVPIDQYLDFDALNSTLVPGFLDSARYQGRVYAAPMRMAVKSIVWYPKQAYEEGGWSTEPATMAELQEVAQQIQDDTGATPWCVGWESAQATGWVGTDWIEEFMLRLHGPDVYDDWIYGRMAFDDPRVVEAFDAYSEVITDDNVLGGNTGILTTGFDEAMAPAFDDDPACYLMRQGNFATSFFPADIQENLDEEIGIYVFPPIEGGYEGQPILGGGDLAAAFSYDDDTIEVMKFLTSDQFGGPWAQGGGWLSPHSTFDSSLYVDDLTRQIADMAYNADVFRYDGSDVMPKEVGSDSFWKGMNEYQDGAKTAEEVTAEIWRSWPEDLKQTGDEAAQTEGR